ncbi:hypothetical protein [Flavobacterium saccharophilum]|uniref:Uncharacterized protein n=1 Tax=Flavobacterium saccharophilum TaxID=29534 RepID=A0A1M7E4T7_9FLAO|nr:hypothetical protein [Flavobacterium saccharophilum]SHL86686.1 hypothetical protein SAMN05444366_1844 [Flavobacterium saccharophilum]
MKTINPADFPIEMNTENINILANMALVIPVLPEWRKISLEILTDDERLLVSKKVSELNYEKRKQRLNSLSIEELEKEQKSIEEKDQNQFYRNSNLLQQELDSINLENIKKKMKKK